MKKTNNLEEKINIKFTNPNLLKEALTHRSYLNEKPDWPLPHNERLEYLGDAVLELSITEKLFSKFPDYSEGQLTILRSALVNYQLLSRISLSIGLDNFILMSKGEAKDTGKAREVILANAIEALIGAIYLDRGFKEAGTFIEKFVFVYLEEILRDESYKDPKSKLQEIIQEKLKITPSYKVLSEEGPAHRRIFKIGVFFGDEIIAVGSGASKQEGEIEAARAALKKH